MTTVQHISLTMEWRCMNEVSKFSFTAHNPPSVITCANWIVTLSSDVSQHDTVPGVSKDYIFNEMFTTSLVAAVHKVRGHYQHK